MQQLPIVAIVGRANVGKSTLFNKLSESRKAIVSNLAGTTRDRTYAEINWRDKIFKLVDTGGMDIEDQTISQHKQATKKEFETSIKKQAYFAIAEAELILFLVDCKLGAMPQDLEMIKFLRSRKKPIILVVNKADKLSEKNSIDNEFYKFNINDTISISAANGTGCGDLLDIITKKLPIPKKMAIKKPGIKISLIGRTNVGKSTLFNSLIGRDQAVVSALPHTTRDINDFSFIYNDQLLTIVDTAGLRRLSKIGKISGENKLIKKDLAFIEKTSMNQTKAAIKKADVVVFMVDVGKNISALDKKIAQMIADYYKPTILLINKWDLIKDKDSNTINKFVEYFQYHLPMIDYAYPLFISAIEKQRTKKVFDIIIEVFEKANQDLSNETLNDFISKFIVKHHPRKKRISRTIQRKNKILTISKFKQFSKNPIVFTVTTPVAKDVSVAYLNLMKNKLREQFDFKGVPIIIRTNQKNKPNKKWK